MRAPNRFLYKSALLLVAVLLLIGASYAQRLLNVKREVMGLTRVTPLENAPPVLTFVTVALGGFRGLIANLLWIRASDLQDEDKYFEMVQLADWITKLQPHFVAVWVHQAWNMSYNISIKFSEMHDRWLWVLRGIELLRDEGLRYNPNEPLLYRELAWHFQHKMGANLDDGNNYYKFIWAQEMQELLGPGRPNYEELLHPKSEEVKARVQKLREKYKMDPAWMKITDERYGPLEWRLPETHAIYWAVLGLEKAKQNPTKKEELIQLRRVIFQSMQMAFHRGRLVYPVKNEKTFLYAPNLEIVGRANAAYEEMIESEPDKRDHLGTAHKNFLRTAVYFLYAYNRIPQAREWFNYLRDKYPNAIAAEDTLDSYALSKVAEDVSETSTDRVKAILEGRIEEMYIGLAMGEDDLAAGNANFAKRLWDRFMSEIGEQSKVRVGLPPLSDMNKEVLERLLDPEKGLPPVLADQLRKAMGMPAATPSSSQENPSPSIDSQTNSPPSAAVGNR